MDAKISAALPERAVRRQAEISTVLLASLEQSVLGGRPLDRALAGLYRQHREFGSRDRRYFSALAFAWFRWRGWLVDPARPNPADCVCAWLLDASEMHPAIAWLAGLLPPPPDPRRPLGGAALSEKAEMLGRWLQRPPPDPAGLAPAWLKDALFCPAEKNRDEHARRCLESFQTRPPTWLRLAAGAGDAARAALPAGTAAHPRLPSAFRLPGGCALEWLQRRRNIEIQDLASQCVGLICAAAPGEIWWDPCAGAGGKALHLADLMRNKGSILAGDARADSLSECRRRAARGGYSIIAARTWNGTEASAPDRMFDGVLLDASCSGLGTWHRNPDARWRTPEDAVGRSAALQASLLRIAADRVRPGGRLVYAVCTLTAAETAGVIDSFLAERADFAPDPLEHPLTGETVPGLIWIWPWEADCNGMFIARLRRGAGA